jgi:hypothetical protein
MCDLGRFAVDERCYRALDSGRFRGGSGHCHFDLCGDAGFTTFSWGYWDAVIN